MAGILPNQNRGRGILTPSQRMGRIGQILSTYGEMPFGQGAMMRARLPYQWALRDASREQKARQASLDEMYLRRFDREEEKYQRSEDIRDTEASTFDTLHPPSANAPVTVQSEPIVALPQTPVAAPTVGLPQAPVQGNTVPLPQLGTTVPPNNMTSGVIQSDEYIAGLIETIKTAENTVPSPPTMKGHRAQQEQIMGWKKELNDLQIKSGAFKNKMHQGADGYWVYSNQRKDDGSLVRVDKSITKKAPNRPTSTYTDRYGNKSLIYTDKKGGFVPTPQTKPGEEPPLWTPERIRSEYNLGDFNTASVTAAMESSDPSKLEKIITKPNRLSIAKWDKAIDAARLYIKSAGFIVGEKINMGDRAQDPGLGKQMEIAMRVKFSEGGLGISAEAIELLNKDPSPEAIEEFEKHYNVDAGDYIQ